MNSFEQLLKTILFFHLLSENWLNFDLIIPRDGLMLHAQRKAVEPG